MERSPSGGVVRVTIADWTIDEFEGDRPRHGISEVAARSGVRVATLRRYEEWGLVQPSRAGRQRLYSDADIERVLRARRLIEDLGMNLAGAAAVLHLRQQVIALQRELQLLREQRAR